jgi:hypothetical protein
MPIELQVIRASEFIRWDAHHYLDLEASKEALRTLALACRKRGLNSALVDLRTLPVLPKPHFTTTQLAALVGTFREAGFSRQQRLAILYRHDIHGGVRNFAFISRMRGLQVLAFSEFETALHWLSEGTDREMAAGERTVPISITKDRTGARQLAVSAGMPRPARKAVSKRL